MARSWVALVLLLGCGSSAFGQQIDSSAFASIAQALTARGDSAAIAVAVAHRGRIVFEAAHGHVDAGRTERATGQTSFAVGSVAKTVTALTVMRLAARGLIALDAPIERYLPGELSTIRGDAARMTPRTLLAMTAGLPHIARHHYEASGAAPSAESLVRGHGVAVFPPGELFHYSNLSYGVLERLIERVTGRRFDDVVQEEVFAPLGMTNAFFATALNRRPYALRRSAAGAAVEGYRFTEPEGGAGLVASARDLARLGSAFATRDSTFLPAAMFDLMTTPTRAEWQYGLGVWLAGAGLTFDGAVLGGAGIVRVVPQHDLVVAVVTNQVGETTATYEYAGPLLTAALHALGAADQPMAPSPFSTTQPFHTHETVAGAWQGSLPGGAAPIPVRIRFDTDSILIGIANEALVTASTPTTNSGLLRFSFPRRAAATQETWTARLLIGRDTISGYLQPPADRNGLGWPVPIMLVRATSKPPHP